MIQLTGIAWNHSRALPAVVATAQRYEELHPEVRVRWEKRSLHDFGHMPIDTLAGRFDLIVIDHPWAGYCFARDLVHDLAPVLSKSQRLDLECNTVGSSFDSYVYDNRLLAVPIDAATPVPSARPDLMAQENVSFPTNWLELVAFADTGRAVMPGFPPDLFLNWLMLVTSLGATICAGPDEIAPKEMGYEAMEMLKRLSQRMPADIFSWNPITIAERMTRSNDFVLCIFAYCYSNYCRPSFVDHNLCYGLLPAIGKDLPLRGIIGGTGMAITKQCRSVDAAIDYALFTGSAPVQAGIYAFAGGQPARSEAWSDAELNAHTGGFFSSILPDQDKAFIRPRYQGFVPFQEEGGMPLQHFLRGRINRESAWELINSRYRASLPDGPFPTL